MLDIGWSEMAVIALVALVVIGPKDLPKVMRTMGQWMRKARSVSREFQSSIDEMIRDAELDDAKKAIQSTRSFNVDRMLDETIDPTGDLKKEVRAVDAAARDSGDKAGSAKAVESKTADGKATDDKTPDDKKGDGTAEPTGGATVINHPAQPAPPHSLVPPKEPAKESQRSAAPSSAAKPAAPAPDDDAGQKTSGQKSA